MANRQFRVDVETCTGCKLCVVSCKDEHFDNAQSPWAAPQPETGHFWVDVKAIERGQQPRVKVSYMPVFCQHCAAAPCIPVCPEDAIKTRDDGLVWIDPASCTGCRKCEAACPYGVIYFNKGANIAQKCTGCAHRVDEGLEPRCVDVCPHDAIQFGSEGDFGDASLEIMMPEANAAPRVLWNGLPKPWIAGTVIDQSEEEVMAGAKVSVVDISDDTRRQAITDAFGDFWIMGLEEDRRYRVEVEKDGYILIFQSVTTEEGDQDLGTIAMTRA